MSRANRPIIASQAREDIRKLSDLIEVAGSRVDRAIWDVSGVRYEWAKGARYLTAWEGLGRRSIELPEASRLAAKKAVFAEVREL